MGNLTAADNYSKLNSQSQYSFVRHLIAQVSPLRLHHELRPLRGAARQERPRAREGQAVPALPKDVHQERLRLKARQEVAQRRRRRRRRRQQKTALLRGREGSARLSELSNYYVLYQTGSSIPVLPSNLQG